MPSAGSGQRSVSVWSLEPACECDNNLSDQKDYDWPSNGGGFLP